METFEVTLTLTAQVQAFTQGDAVDAIQDIFGVGSDGGVEVIKMEVSNIESVSEPE